MPFTLTHLSVVGPLGTIPQKSSIAEGSPQAPVDCAFVRLCSCSATTSGKRIITSAQAGSLASTAGCKGTSDALQAAREAPKIRASAVAGTILEREDKRCTVSKFKGLVCG